MKPSFKTTPVSGRSVVAGLICVALICFTEAHNDYYVNNTWLAAHHFPIVAAFLLMVLILGGNVFLKEMRLFDPLKAGELITIWCMMIVVASLPTLGLAAYMIPTLVGLTYYATPENDWVGLFHHYLPRWLIPRGSSVAQNFFEGLTGSDEIPWLAWIPPLLFWSGFTFVLWGMMVCLATILRRQWVEKEKFSFPLVQLPAEMSQDPPAGAFLNTFFRRRSMWIAFLCPVVIHSVSTLHFYYPFFPEIPLRYSTWHLFTEKPWNALRPFNFDIQPSTIGLSYLMSLEISFSLWVFYLIYKLERLIGSATGISTYLYHQRFVPFREMGAYLVVILFFAFLAREHLKKVWMKTYSGKSMIIDADEPLPYRWAVVGLLATVVGLSVLLVLAGATSLWLMLSILTFFSIVCVIDAWLVTRGLFFIHGSFKAPDLFVSALGTSRFGTANLTIIAFPKRIFFRDRREILMPHLVNSFKVSDEARVNRRHLLLAIGLALAVGTVISFYGYLKLAYIRGAVTLGRSWIHTISPREPFRELERFLVNPQDTNWQQMSFVAIGSLMMFGLWSMQYRFVWWPLHPIGFVTPGQFPMNNIWFSIFLGWLFKFLLVRQGGLKGYRQARPIFLGIVLGEAFVAGIWAIIGLFTGKGYNFLYF
ncbi:MAG: hypothetical protein QGI86_19625 [Candidatus Poribacteria bacterium]|jgi:hypothetical protein|nr:hypothetical protein [Candidatus Poribacteria bacterium]MDP6751854.1 hypothetical protein [Candidatus Poribacteria bacterium]MDP6997584.1 hypothetical protein [Candidatus Poribacteria bacterium]